MMNKTAYDQGIADAYAALGLEKTAIWGHVARGVGAVGRFMSRRGTSLLSKDPVGTLGKVQQFGGRTLQNAGKHLRNSSSMLAADPMGTLGHGAMNFGKGALMFGGKGVGGALGKGVGAYGMGSAMFGGGGGAQAPQQMMPQPQYNQMYGGY